MWKYVETGGIMRKYVETRVNERKQEETRGNKSKREETRVNKSKQEETRVSQLLFLFVINTYEKYSYFLDFCQKMSKMAKINIKNLRFPEGSSKIKWYPPFLYDVLSYDS